MYFEEDWDTGIGGGLWSTGLAIGKYLTTSNNQHAKQLLVELSRRKDSRCDTSSMTASPSSTVSPLTVLELGSGNGFLAVCLLALAQHVRTQQQQQQQQRASDTPVPLLIRDLVITDTQDHLDMIRTTLEANAHLLGSDDNTDPSPSCRVQVLEHLWGEFQEPTISHTNDFGRKESGETIKEGIRPEQVQEGTCTFDLIVGSDLAYRKELYDPLIASLQRFSSPHTVSMIGVTMADTTPSFFRKLSDAGFTYVRMADHLMDREFRGNLFGIFLISKKDT